MGAVRRLKLTPEALRSRAAQVRAISRRLTSRFHGGVARQMPWLAERHLTTSAGVEANQRMATALTEMHAQGGPAWAPEVAVDIEVHVLWRTALGVPQRLETDVVALAVPMRGDVVRLNKLAERIGRLSP